MKDNMIFKDNRTFFEKTKSVFQSLLFWKGRKKGIIHTRNITLSDIRAIFFPKDFSEKYGYLGTTIWNEEGGYFKALYPLVLALDYEAKPKWCPRWFLRFLHVFGDDKSIVRVRNRTLSDLKYKLTKGIAFIDWKSKWEWYDLRISIHAPKHLQDLACGIENKFYSTGRRKDLVEEILKLDPKSSISGKNIEELQHLLNELEDGKEEKN
jgi:hypothetical protein